VVCSTCGYENQVGNRFCGMCGTPLPHRPLTTPGAQSTANLTRALGDNVGPVATQVPATSPSRTNLEGEARSHTRDERNLSEPSSSATDVASEIPRSGSFTPRFQDAMPGAQRSAAATPSQFDLVPEIPLHEYVQNFRYMPPSDPEEITMRGENPVFEPRPPAKSDAASSTVDPAIASDVALPPTPDDVRERLGLEVNTAAEERSDRPRFLDFNEPIVPPEPAVSATPIAGPSFLGLGDVPHVETETASELVVQEPTRWKWRMWLAATVILVFGFLGVLEWRAQVRQANNGPLEVIKMKMRNLTRGKPAESPRVDSASVATNAGSGAKPELQVGATSKPPNPNPPATATTSGEAKDAKVPSTNAATTPLTSSLGVTAAPGGNQVPGGRSTAVPQQSPVPNSASAPAGQNKSTTTKAPADKSARAADDGEEVIVKKIVPGADEMAKANKASDSTAEAAWLWKATAKGNPTAPVRLADMYVKGDGVPRSCEQAMVLLKTAAEKENAMARTRLASMYSSGICVQRNRVEAYRWLSSALVADPNSDWAQQNRDMLWRQMTPEERTVAEQYR
jgi:zinc-ribbon domain